MPEDDAKLRIETFVKEYGELVEKHNVDFANYPQFVPDAEGTFRVTVQTRPVDMKAYAQKSPFMVKE